MEKWVSFRRSRPDRVVDLVRRVAEARDPGEHGHGVEVVVEAPRTKWWKALFNRDDKLAQARIVVTREGGEVRYPFDIQLVTAYGANAAHRVGTRRGWAVSNSAGLAFVIQKGTHRTEFDFEELTAGAVAALARLRRKPRERGWRARIDRSVRRS
ncbi:hypothetical protein AB0M46_26495 [Dactylosporangium sp. NPDC051485]|uniref:hypothetical protein n=1 Tax=Dactylosporangium sp. NPDC051485 TaxID=3154846 RepID=UPI0034261ECA